MDHALSSVVAIATLLFSIVWWKKLRSRLEVKCPFFDLPMLPGNHWLSGHLSILRTDFQTRMKVISSISKDGLCSLWIFNSPVLVVTRWEDARAVLRSSPSRDLNWWLSRHSDMFLGPRNIGRLRGKEWKFHRSSILRAFGPKPVQESQGAILEVCRVFVESIRRRIAETDDLEMNVEPLMKMIAIDIFGLAALSTDLKCCSSLSPSPIAEAFDFLSTELIRRLQNPFGLESNFYSLPTNANRRHFKARKILRSFIADAIKERQEQVVSSGACEKKDLLFHLLKANQDEDQFNDMLSDETLSDLMMSLLFAGYDTTSVTLSYALHNISQHPEVERRCLEEIAKVSDDGDFDVGLEYCRAVITETLRLYPPAIGNARTVSSPLKLSNGYVVPAGTMVATPTWAIHRDSHNFARPTEFLPTRWVSQDPMGAWHERSLEENLQSDEVVPANPKAFFAFSAGARSCPGRSFAMQEAVIVLASLLKEFSFQTRAGYLIKPKRFGPIQRPDGGIPMTIRARD